MITARSVMTTKLITAREETPLEQAVRLLMEHHISGLPVVDGANRLVGILTEKDLLRLLDDDAGGARTVGELMVREVRTFQVDDPLHAICDCLLANHYRRVPILDGDKLVGLISRADLLQTILEAVADRAK